MSLLESLRDATVLLIAENPVNITVHRIEFKDDGAGGRYKEESDLASFTGRLVPSKQSVQKQQNEAGEIQFAEWVLIAPWNADVKTGSDIEDTFSAKGKPYRINRLVEREYRGEVHALHCMVEEMN